MSLDEALFERRAMYSPDRAVQKYVNEYGKKEFIDGYEVGYIDGLNAAREAVVAMPYDEPEDDPQSREHEIDVRQRYLTVIDALREGDQP